MNIATEAPKNRVDVRVNGVAVTVPESLVGVIVDAGVREAKTKFNRLVDGARHGTTPYYQSLTEIGEALDFTAACNSQMR